MFLMHARAEEQPVRSFLAKHKFPIYSVLVALFVACCAISVTSLVYFDRYNQRFLHAFGEIHEGMPSADARKTMDRFGPRTTTFGTHLGEFPQADEFDLYSTNLLADRYLTVVVIGYGNNVVAMKGGYNADRVLREADLTLPGSHSVFSFRPLQTLLFVAGDITALYPLFIAAFVLALMLFSSLRTNFEAWLTTITIFVGAGLLFLVGAIISPATWLIVQTAESFFAP